MALLNSDPTAKLSIKGIIKEIQRVKEITNIIITLIFDVIISFLLSEDSRGKKSILKRILGHIISFLFRKKSTDYPFPVKLRLTLEKLGPTYVKFGQIMSLRKDFLPEDITNELANLQNNVPPFPFYQVREILENQYSKPINEVFKSIERKTLAAASLAQAHIAYTKNGRKVVLKIRRPGIVDKITHDIRIMRFIAKFAEKWIPISRGYQPVKIVEEFSDYTMRELDFRTEGQHCDKFNANFKSNRWVSFPKVYWEYTTEQVLCMEYIEGCKANQVDIINSWGLDKRLLVQRGVDAILQMLFLDGFFHGDPHPGNMFITREGKIVFIDVGMIGRFSKEVRKNMFLYFFNMVTEQYENATKYFLAICAKKENANEEGFRQELSEQLQSWKELGITKYTLAQLIMQTMLIGARNGILFPKDNVLMAKCLVTIEVVGEYWDPDIDLASYARPFLEKLFMEFYSPKIVLMSMVNSLPDYVEFVQYLPQYTLNIFKKFETGTGEVELSNPKQIRAIVQSGNKERTIGLMSVCSVVAGSLMMLSDNLQDVGWKAFDIFPLPTTVAFFLGIILFAYVMFKKIETAD